MNICVISGPSNIGKTKTIQLIDEIFKNSSECQLLFTNRVNNYKDFESVYKRDKKVIGLISIGDTKSEIEKAFKAIKGYNIDYLICTSKSWGKTVEYVESLSDRVVRVYKPYFAKDNVYNEDLNCKFAQYIYDVVLNYLAR